MFIFLLICSPGTSHPEFATNNIAVGGTISAFQVHDWSVSHHALDEDGQPPRNQARKQYVLIMFILRNSLKKTELSTIITIFVNLRLSLVSN